MNFYITNSNLIHYSILCAAAYLAYRAWESVILRLYHTNMVQSSSTFWDKIRYADRLYAKHPNIALSLPLLDNQYTDDEIRKWDTETSIAVFRSDILHFLKLKHINHDTRSETYMDLIALEAHLEDHILFLLRTRLEKFYIDTGGISEMDDDLIDEFAYHYGLYLYFFLRKQGTSEDEVKELKEIEIPIFDNSTLCVESPIKAYMQGKKYYEAFEI